MYMDAMTFNNGQHNNKTLPKKPRIKTSTFSQVVLKSDVGEFQDGIFVAAEPVKENHSPNRTKNYHKTTLERPKSEGTLYGRPTPQHREHSYPNIHQHNNVQYVPPSGDRNVSSERLTSPARSPNRRHSPNSQVGYADHSANSHPHTLSPPKHRKPLQEKLVERPEGSDRGGSPPKDNKSPAPSRWAGPAFSNAPPPSSLPIPDFFPPFSSPTSSPSSSPPPAPVPSQLPHPPQSSIPPQLPFPTVPPPAAPVYHEPYVYSQPPAYYHQHPAFFSSYAYPSSREDQLSMDLRRMLRIEQPVAPILA